MLTRTSELAIKALLHMGIAATGGPSSPRDIALALDCSPSYLSKILGMLVKARLLRSRRGVGGGVHLARDPADISLLDIVEACEGTMVAAFCRDLGSMQLNRSACAFHQAMDDVHRATTAALARWSLADLVNRPAPLDRSNRAECRMAMARRPAVAPVGRGPGSNRPRSGSKRRLS